MTCSARMSATHEGVSRRELRRLGTKRAERADRGRLRSLGRPADADAVDGRQRRLGALRARHRRRRALQVRDPRPGRDAAAQSRSACLRDAGSPRDRVARVGYDLLHVVGQRLDGRASDPQPVHVTDGRLRGPPRLLATQSGRLVAGLSRGGPAAGRALPPLRIHARRAAAGGRAPVRRLVGLPGHRLLRPDLPIRLAGRLRCHGRHPAQRRHRGAGRLGARALPDRRLRAPPLRRDRAVRARRSAARRASRLGHAHLRLRPPRGPQLPGRQRALLVRPLSHRRSAGGCGGLDALPRLLTQGRPVDAERPRRAREPRGDRLPARDERARLPALPGRGHHRGGVDRIPRHHRGRPISAASASASNGTWAGCTTRSRSSRRTRSIAASTTTS